MWTFSLQIYRAMSSFTVKAFAAYFTSAHQLNNEKVSNPPGRCYLASGSKGSPEKILTIWIVREKGSRAVFELLIRPGICDLEAAPLESPAAPPSSQGSRLSDQHQIFYISKGGNIALAKNTRKPADWAVLRIISQIGALYHCILSSSNVPSWFGLIKGQYVFNITFYKRNHRPAGWVLHVEELGCTRWSSTQVWVVQDQHPVGQNCGTLPLGLARAAPEFLSLREDIHHAMRALGSFERFHKVREAVE